MGMVRRGPRASGRGAAALLLVGMLVATLTSPALGAAPAAGGGGPDGDATVLVLWDAEVAADGREQTLARVAGAAAAADATVLAPHLDAVTVRARDASRVATSLRALPGVASATVDRPVLLAALPDDPLAPFQWALDNDGTNEFDGQVAVPGVDARVLRAW
jgi:hypothetical protein